MSAIITNCVLIANATFIWYRSRWKSAGHNWLTRWYEQALRDGVTEPKWHPRQPGAAEVERLQLSMEH